MKKRVSKEEKLEALKDYLSGVPLRKIALKYGVKESTVKKWAERDGWSKRRKEEIAKAEKSVYNKMQTQLIQSTERFLEVAKLGSNLSLVLMHEIHKSCFTEDNKPKKDEILRQMPELIKLAKMSCEFSKVQKNSLPAASEELSKAILKELQRLGKAHLLPGTTKGDSDGN